MYFINTHIGQIGNPTTPTLYSVLAADALLRSGVFDEICLLKS